MSLDVTSFALGTVFLSVVTTFLLYNILTSILPRFLVVPPENWLEKIQKTINSPKPVYLTAGLKQSAYRRRLILATSNVSFYTNFENDKIKISSEDKSSSAEFIKNMSYRDPKDSRRKLIFGFFHPYANAGGGGERVLWAAVESTLNNNKRNIVAIYTGDGVNQDGIIDNVEKKFHFKLDSKRIVFIYLKKRHLIDPANWPRLTLLGQALGSIILSFEAVSKLSPDVWVDTIGLPFSYPLVYFSLRIPILSYVHYPIIQKQMIQKLKLNQMLDFTHIRSLGDVKIYLKFLYWSSFVYIYTLVGSMVDVTLTNSTWTYNHIKKIWWLNNTADVSVLYPPCGTDAIVESEKNHHKPSSDRMNYILCIAQFRPEKRHELIIHEYAKFLSVVDSDSVDIPKLILLGSTRSNSDKEMVNQLKSLVKKLEIPESYIEFVLDAKYEEMLHWLSISKYGLNAMWNEHFGIAVVEYMASGLIPLVHASSGPLYDIVVPWDCEKKLESDGDDHKTGFFFKSAEDPDYKDQSKSDDSTETLLTFKNPKTTKFEKYPVLSSLLVHLTEVDDLELNGIAERGTELVLHKFSNQQFENKWSETVDEMIRLEFKKRDGRGKVEKVY